MFIDFHQRAKAIKRGKKKIFTKNGPEKLDKYIGKQKQINFDP